MEDTKVLRNQLRRAAARQGYKLTKSSRRDPQAPDYGGWWVLDLDSKRVIMGGKNGATLEQVAALLGVTDQ